MSQATLSRIEAGERDVTAGEEALILAALFERAREVPALEEPHLAPYPAAPLGPERQVWMRRRNEGLQAAKIATPASGSFGAIVKTKKTAA